MANDRSINGKEEPSSLTGAEGDAARISSSPESAAHAKAAVDKMLQECNSWNANSCSDAKVADRVFNTEFAKVSNGNAVEDKLDLSQDMLTYISVALSSRLIADAESHAGPTRAEIRKATDQAMHTPEMTQLGNLELAIIKERMDLRKAADQP